jgi:hypothetical protein
VAIDTAIQNIDLKTLKRVFLPDVYATKLQYDIYTAKLCCRRRGAPNTAIKILYDKNLKLRWTFILAQLQELKSKPADLPLHNYSSIVTK